MSAHEQHTDPGVAAVDLAPGGPATGPDAPAHGTRRELEAMVVAPLVIAALVTLVLLAFGIPAVKGAPHDLPLGVAGPPAATTQVSQALTAREPGAFDVTTYSSAAQLTRAIRDREVYGGIVVTPSGPQVLTASAASPVVAQALTAMGAQLAAQQGTQPQITDVVPLPAEDPRGAGIVASLLPIIAGSIVPVVALVRLTRRRRTQIVGVLVSAAAAGLAYAAVLHGWLGTLQGNYLAESAVFAGALAAGGLALLGLNRVAGLPGVGLGAAVLLLLGNPLSGAATAPEFFPPAWSAVGQAITPGATIQLLRSVSFFDGAAATGPIVVLSAWAAAGLLLLALPSRRSRQDAA
jgi:hypothetical protein